MSKHNNPKSPWRVPSNNKKARGEKYEEPSDSDLQRGHTRRAIEDRQLAKELLDDPLFDADQEMIGADADYGITVGDK